MTPARALDRRRAEVEELAVRLAVAQEQLRAAEAKERRAAIVDALALFGGSPTRRSTALATEYSGYLGRVWPRERHLDEPPAGATAKHRALHRIAKSRDGAGIKARQIFNLGFMQSSELAIAWNADRSFEPK